MITVPLRILLVEDNQTDIDLITRSLKKIVEVPKIRVVDNLKACSAEIYAFLPDVIISDYNLPTCTGLDVLELARSRDSSIPFIFLTGIIDDEEMAANTILAGASGFILKKNMERLDEKLKPYLKKIVFNMDVREEIREKVRRNKIAVNQIYNYLDAIGSDNKEQRSNLEKIRKNIDLINLEGKEDDT